MEPEIAMEYIARSYNRQLNDWFLNLILNYPPILYSSLLCFILTMIAHTYILCPNLKRSVIMQACYRTYWEADCGKGPINFFISHF